MSAPDTAHDASESLRAFPPDEARRVLWRFADRPDLHEIVASARAVARGPVARLVAEGGRGSLEWTASKAELLSRFDEAGLSSLFLDPDLDGTLDGPRNLALALAIFELAWVDGGAATCNLAGYLALSPIRERGTPEQVRTYTERCSPGRQGKGKKPWRGAFCLTEPIPNVGVDTGMLSGRVRIAEWPDGKEPVLQVEKRGRFINSMDYANFVVAAVDSGDERIRGSCMIILEEGDPGLFDRGTPTRKLVHQISSTRDPVFSVKVPASRIVGGYSVEAGVLVPAHGHGEVLDAVFRGMRVTVGLMTSAKLLSSVEPIIRYQRERYRGSDRGAPGTPRHDLGLQQKEDALHRLVDIWAAGEAGASLGFAAARHFDAYKSRDGTGAWGSRARLRARQRNRKDALDCLQLAALDEEDRDSGRFDELRSDPLVDRMIQESIADVLGPACKLWNTGQGANMMREAVNLMGGYGLMEHCPGFIGQKWMDSQLEATYEGPEAVHRKQLSVSITDELFQAQFLVWIREMREISNSRPGTGACALGTAMELWLWSLRHLLHATDADGKPLYRGHRQGVTFSLADALCWLLAARYQILDVIELEQSGPSEPKLAESLSGLVRFLNDLCHVQVARAAGETSSTCAELVFGYQRHPAWDGDCESCFRADELESLEGVMPGIAASGFGMGDVVEADGTHPHKAGPCVRFAGMSTFMRLRGKLDGCLTGARLAKDRAARALTRVAIPEFPDYPS